MSHFTIVHLSDLHFTKATSLQDSHLEALIEDIPKHKPDLIVCTGDIAENKLIESIIDESSFTKSLELGRQYLEKICQDSELNPNEKLFVVPGNHDYYIHGVKTFSAGEYKKAVFMHIFEAYFKNRLVKLSKIGNFGLQVLLFDSNDTADQHISFATGKVNSSEFTKASRAQSRWDKDKGEIVKEYYKIALLHHHPMPISSVETRTGIKMQKFLILANAGTFIEEMIKRDIDLILHGHQHVIGYSRILLHLPGTKVNNKKLGIIAAGSAGVDHNNIYSYNVLKIYVDHRVKLDHRIRIGGTYQSSKGEIEIVSTERARSIRYKKMAQHIGFDKVPIEGAGLLYHVNIDRYGGLERRILYKSITRNKNNNTPVEYFPVDVATTAGTVHERTYECTNDVNQNVTFLKSMPNKNKKQNIPVIRFTPNLNEVPKDIEGIMKATSIFCFNKDDLKHIKSEQDYEFIRKKIMGVYNFLDFRITFDKKAPPPIDPTIKVYEPNMEKPDHMETSYATDFFYKSNDNRELRLVIDRPIPNFKYSIEWNLKDNIFDVCDLEAFAIGGIKKAENSQLALLYDQDNSNNLKIESAIQKELDRIRSQLSKDKILETELKRIDVHFFVFDPNYNVPSLRCIAESIPDRKYSLVNETYKKGEGIVGQAFLRRSFLHCLLLTQQSPGRELYKNPTTTKYPQPVAVFGIPLNYPKTEIPIALIRVATHSEISGLLRLFEEKEKLNIKFLNIVSDKSIRNILSSMGIKMREAPK